MSATSVLKHCFSKQWNFALFFACLLLTHDIDKGFLSVRLSATLSVLLSDASIVSVILPARRVA